MNQSNDDVRQNIKKEQRIFYISITGSIAFLIAEIIIAWISGSKAIIMDVVFSVADVIMLGPILMLIPLLYRPTSDSRPFGYSQLESVFLLIKCGLLFIITVYLIISSIQTILAGGNEVDSGIVAVFELITSVICFAIYLILSHLNKSASSPSVDTEIYIWKLDSLTTLGVGVAFALSFVIKDTPADVIIPFIDPTIAILLAAVLLREPFRMLISSIRSLALFAPREEIGKKVRQISTKRLDEEGYLASDIDILTTGRKTWIEIYVFPKEGDNLNLSALSRACAKIKSDIKGMFEEYDVEISADLDEAESEKEKRKRFKHKKKIEERMRRGQS